MFTIEQSATKIFTGKKKEARKVTVRSEVTHFCGNDFVLIYTRFDG